MVVMNWSFYSSKFLTNVVNEYKFTIFIIAKTHSSFTNLSGNRDRFIDQKKICTLQIILCLMKMKVSLSCIMASLCLKCLINVRVRCLSEMHSQKLNNEQSLWHSAQDFFPHYLY